MLVKFEQNRMVQTTRNFELFDKKKKKKKKKKAFFFQPFLTKRWRHFGRLPSASVSKNYISLTRVIRLKVTPNMADPISIKNSVSSLNCSRNNCLIAYGELLMATSNSYLLE